MKYHGTGTLSKFIPNKIRILKDLSFISYALAWLKVSRDQLHNNSNHKDLHRINIIPYLKPNV